MPCLHVGHSRVKSEGVVVRSPAPVYARSHVTGGDAWRTFPLPRAFLVPLHPFRLQPPSVSTLSSILSPPCGSCLLASFQPSSRAGSMLQSHVAAPQSADLDLSSLSSLPPLVPAGLAPRRESIVQLRVLFLLLVPFHIGRAAVVPSSRFPSGFLLSLLPFVVAHLSGVALTLACARLPSHFSLTCTHSLSSLRTHTARDRELGR